MRSVPTNHEEHTAEIIELLPKLVLRLQGCLVLFASRRQMEEVSKAMPQHISPLLLIQGHFQNGKYCCAISSESTVVSRALSLVWLLSVKGWICGVYCNNVIIAKLPFSVPTDPVGQTLTGGWRKRA